MVLPFGEYLDISERIGDAIDTELHWGKLLEIEMYSCCHVVPFSETLSRSASGGKGQRRAAKQAGQHFQVGLDNRDRLSYI